MIKLSTSIEHLIKENKFSTQFLLGYLDLKWEEIVGSKIAGSTSIETIKEKVTS